MIYFSQWALLKNLVTSIWYFLEHMLIKLLLKEYEIAYSANRNSRKILERCITPVDC